MSDADLKIADARMPDGLPVASCELEALDADGASGDAETAESALFVAAVATAIAAVARSS